MPDYTVSIVEIKKNIITALSAQLDALLDVASNPRPESGNRDLETGCWRILIVLGRLMLVAALTVRCRSISQADAQARGLASKDVTYRFDEGHVASVTTTVGAINVPLFAYREAGTGKTRNPARPMAFPLLPKCRSSDLLLEWETRLGVAHPFRLAQEELGFFSHAAVSLEDTTIASHMKAAAAGVARSWLYRDVKDIREILDTRATRETGTDRPVIYMSSDAHALRRFVDETWEAPWKMANGLRIWCEDKATGEIIHLGGEYTWGDCKHVNSIFQDLIRLGIVPANGDYGGGIRAKLIWLSDGMPWFEDHILPLFESNAVEVILDAYHVLERVAKCMHAVFGKKSAEGSAWYARAAEEVAGKRTEAAPQRGTARKGHKKNARANKHLRLVPQGTTPPEPDHTPKRLLDLIAEAAKAAASDDAQAACQDLRSYITGNSYRINYAKYRHLGLAIGSGAMESLHRIGSQLRLKRPGLRACAETSQAIFTWRMLLIVGRWEEFWAQKDLTKLLAATWGHSPIQYELQDAA